MFAEHQPLIREYAMQSADHTADVGYFVLATIQQQFSVVRESYWDMKDKGLDSKFAWGSKAAGMKRIQATKEGIYKDMFGYSQSNAELLLVIASIPGLGLVVMILCCGDTVVVEDQAPPVSGTSEDEKVERAASLEAKAKDDKLIAEQENQSEGETVHERPSPLGMFLLLTFVLGTIGGLYFLIF